MLSGNATSLCVRGINFERLSKIMKTYLLTIAGLVVLTLAVLFVAKALWLAETEPITESEDTKQIQEKIEAESLEAKPVFKMDKPEWLKTTDKAEIFSRVF